MSTQTTFDVPLSERINFRLIGFVAVVAVLLGIPAYWYVDSVVSGGIKDRGEYLEVDLRAMSTFPFDGESGTLADIPERWRNLDGQRVMLVGEMWVPYNVSPHVDYFELVYSIQECCFSGPPQIQHFIHSTVPNGETVRYYAGLVRVMGTLRVNVIQDEGRVASVYQLEVESVRPARS